MSGATAPGASAQAPPCRFCGAPLVHDFVDLGLSPLCQTHVEEHQLGEPEEFFPLRVRVCERCFLVQLAESVAPQRIFGEYAYFSSYVDALVESARAHCEAMVKRLGLGAASRVVEIASNDGYALQHYAARGIPVLGIEPAANVAAAARERGVPTLVRFVGRDTAREVVASHGRADFVFGNNVLAHVPALGDFVAGLAILLAPRGTLTMEFPHVAALMEGNQFDTIYHEHFSYFSFTTAERVFAAHGLRVFDVEEIPLHGGSLRVHVCHDGDGAQPTGARVAALRARERDAGLGSLETYAGFAERVRATKRDLLALLVDVKRRGRRVAAYGAAGKAVTLLNYCGIRTDFVDYCVDRNPYKQGKYLAGVRIPIHPPERLRQTRPDYVLILPWNLREEIVRHTAYVRDWGGRWIVPIPHAEVIEAP
jgi:SAM-dependent methyltransferase